MKNRKLLVVAALAIGAGAMSWAGEGTQPALHGYCPVAYSAMGKAVPGKPEFETQYAGQTYRFASAEARGMFAQAPEKYLPAYDGACATAMAEGKKLASDPKLFTVKDGRTYLFSSAKAKAMFDKDPAAVIARADAQWEAQQRTAR